MITKCLLDPDLVRYVIYKKQNVVAAESMAYLTDRAYLIHMI